MLVLAGVSLLLGNVPNYHWTTILWGAGLVLFSGAGCFVICDFRRMERQLGGVIEEEVAPETVVSSRDLQTNQ